MEAWQSWTIFGLATAGAAYYYTTSGGQKKRGSGWKPFTPQQAQRRNSSRSRIESRDKRRKENQASGSDQAADETTDASTTPVQASGTESLRQRKGKQQQPSKLAKGSTADARDDPNDGGGGADPEEDEGMDNLEFAKQLSDKMTGTSLKKPDTTQNKKLRRQAKRAEMSMAETNGSKSNTNGAVPLQENSTASSTTGGDADDDLSSTNSPELSATNATTPSGRDVSDMLEQPGKGPSVLRLTAPANPQPQRQQKEKKPVQEPESKKQRQARRKREEEKAIREETEQQRRIALENQRRIAREAEGRPAKNGLGTSQQPSKSAWASSTKAGGNSDTLSKVPPQGEPLLDTFDDDDASAQGGNDIAKQSSSNGNTLNDFPSEEEQMKRLSEMESDNAWNTVSKGGKSKKKGPTAPPPVNNGISDNHKENRTKEASATTGAESSFPKGAAGTALNAQANGVARSSQMPNPMADEAGKPKKATRETIDHTIWNRSNIHEHPDYDPAFPYALTGHPEDSDWAVI